MIKTKIKLWFNALFKDRYGEFSLSTLFLVFSLIVIFILSILLYKFSTQKDRLERELENTNNRYSTFMETNQAALNSYNDLNSNYSKLEKDYNEILKNYEDLSVKFDDLSKDYMTLASKEKIDKEVEIEHLGSMTIVKEETSNTNENSSIDDDSLLEDEDFTENDSNEEINDENLDEQISENIDEESLDDKENNENNE